MPIHRYFLSDFVTVQRQSFFELLEKGLIEEFSKRNPITNAKKDYSFFFYPEYYILTRPEYKPQEAIIKNKSYTSKLFVPVQITNKNQKQIILKWVYIGNIPLMTKRGHFILNGAARVIVNQILRSPGIYYQQKIYENYEDSQSSKPNANEDDSTKGEDSSTQPVNTYKRFYCDLICMRGSWLRLEMDKEKNIWAQMKKGPKIPVYWFLLAMGLSEKVIMKSIMDPQKVFGNLEKDRKKSNLKKKEKITSPILHQENTMEENSSTQNSSPPNTSKNLNSNFKGNDVSEFNQTTEMKEQKKTTESEKNFQRKFFSFSKKQNYPYLKNTPEAWKAIYILLHSKTKSSNSTKTQDKSAVKDKTDTNEDRNTKGPVKNLTELGRQWLFNRFMNPRSYDLGKQGRVAFNKKLGLSIASNQLTLTGLDVLYATDYLIKVEKGIYKTDDIDHLKNRRVRTSGELIQIQIGVGLVRLEKFIRYNEIMLEGKRKELNNIESSLSRTQFLDKKRSFHSYELLRPKIDSNSSSLAPSTRQASLAASGPAAVRSAATKKSTKFLQDKASSAKGKILQRFVFDKTSDQEKSNRFFLIQEKISRYQKMKNLTSSSIINNKAFNSAIREFFGTSPLSQFMDQINPLAELTHKRRLSSMGPGGVTRDTATLAIRGIHPTHYGRICPIETPEGKNTGLVNSMTTYARVNSSGILESPFYKVYKGQVQKNTGMYYLNAEQEEKIKLAAADLYVSPIGFLPKAMIPARIAETFTKISRSSVQFIGVSPLQMVSIAASLIPFLEHDDANRALMGSNMQRQAVPLIRHQRPIVGTGLESRAVSDSGHVIQSKFSGLVTYVSAKKIVVSV